MFSISHPIIENVLFLSLLVYMGWYDCKKLSLDPSVLVLMILMCLLSDVKYSIWLPLTLFIIGYGIMFLAAVIGDFIYQRDSIAGGDMIIAGVCCAYMGLKWFVLAFALSAVIGQLAIWFYYKYHRHLNIPYVPYLAAGALMGMVIK